MQKSSKRTALFLSLFLCSAIFAAPQVKHLSSLKSHISKDLENVTSLIIVMEEEVSGVRVQSSGKSNIPLTPWYNGE